MPFDEMTGVKRQFYRFLFVAGCLFALIDLGLHYNSKLDRRHTRGMQVKLEQQQQQIVEQQRILEIVQKRQDFEREQNREMLDARARCQINLFNAVKEGRRFNQKELDEIEKLWRVAEYDQIQDKFINPTRILEPLTKDE